MAGGWTEMNSGKKDSDAGKIPTPLLKWYK
jgi:hypothetical protein